MIGSISYKLSVNCRIHESSAAATVAVVTLLIAAIDKYKSIE